MLSQISDGNKLLSKQAYDKMIKLDLVSTHYITINFKFIRYLNVTNNTIQVFIIRNMEEFLYKLN